MKGMYSVYHILSNISVLNFKFLCIWVIPCHICHDTGSMFFLLKWYRIPLLILNSSKHPTRFCSGSFRTFCITILTCAPAVALQECVKSVMCVTMMRNINFGDFSHIKQNNVYFTMTKKAIHYLLSKKTCQQHCTFFWKKCNSEEIIPRKAVSCVLHFFVSCVMISFSNAKSLVLCPRKKSKPHTVA